LYEVEQKSSRRGRPRTYERDTVVDSAQDLFWREGASSVSLDALANATGLHKPSLYAAFGSKAGLYVAALDAYIDRGAPDVSGALSKAPLRVALEAFFEADLDVFCGESGKRGCFLIGTAIEAAAGSEAVRERVERVFAGLRAVLRARVDRAVTEGNLPAEVDREAVAEILFATHTALAVEARAGASRQSLRERYRRVVGFLTTLRAA
jgi:AcrR family transcriptional regulator